MAFYVGQKVVCVDASPMRFGHPVSLKKGQVYTVSGVDPTPDRAGEHGVAVFEADDPAHDVYDDFYRASRFRPVVERKTDISLFKAMLNPSREEVSA